jgi:hypothetical protein
VSRSLSKKRKHIPKHRSRRRHAAPAKVLRNTLVLTSVAAAATGVSVSSGVLSQAADRVDTVSASLGNAQNLPALTAAQLSDRQSSEASRDDRRDALDPAKEAALSAKAGAAVTVTEDVSDADPRSVAQALLGEFGFSQDQFGCLDSLWMRESGWRVDANNASSSAYGIPQALPGSKMSSSGPDWATNAATQIRWGLGYIEDRYGSPCSAWGHSQSYGWY